MKTDPFFINTRTLGIIGMITSPFLAIDFLVSDVYENYRATSYSGIFSLIYMTGWLFCIIGLYRLKATGNTAIGKGVLFTQLAFLSLGELWNIYEILEPGANSALYRLLDPFWPISNCFMLVTGLTVIIANKLQGWKRFVPFMVGLWFPVSFVSIHILFGQGIISLYTSGMYSALAWLLLGICVYRSATERDYIQEKHAPALMQV
jgi:hypothetical protein